MIVRNLNQRVGVGLMKKLCPTSVSKHADFVKETAIYKL